jgi:hypothetical protein
MTGNETGALEWSISPSSKYESDWMALHRILWMNSITGENFNALIRKLEGKKPTQSDSAFRYAIESSRHLGYFSTHFHERGRVFLFGRSNEKILFKYVNFKFCLICLENCFHSPVFCLPGVSICPIHHCKLVSECVHCGRWMGSNYFNPTIFSTPLACFRCKKPFAAKNIVSKAVDGFTSNLTMLQTIEDWLLKMKGWEFKISDFSLGEICLPGEFLATSVFACLKILAPPPISNDEALEVEKALIEFDDCENFDFLEYQRRNMRRLATPMNDEISDACAIAKSIGRYLRSQIRHFCDHETSSQSRWENADRPFSRVQPVLMIEAKACPCCAVMDQWRAYAGKLLSLKKAATRDGGLLYDDRMGSNRSVYFLDSKLCAQALVSSFTWFVMELVQFLDDTTRSQSYYRLDTYRFEISVRGFRFRSDKKDRYFRYSLKSALIELEKCHVKIQKRSGFSHPSESRFLRQKKDQWYIDMSNYFWSKRNFEWWNNPVVLEDS